MPPTTGRTTILKLACTSLLLAGCLLLAACGSSKSTPIAMVTTQVGRRTGIPSNPDIGQERSQKHGKASRAGTSSVTQGTKVQQGREPDNSLNDEENESGARPLNPCSLVSWSEANQITGGAVVGQVEAPLGPTCIYRLGGARSEVTLAFEPVSLSSVTHQMHKLGSVSVSGRPGYCGKVGVQMLFVSVAPDAVLAVTAPCAQAQRFAAAALRHLAA